MRNLPAINANVAVAAITRDIKPEEVAAFSAKWGYAPTRISFAVSAKANIRPRPSSSISVPRIW